MLDAIQINSALHVTISGCVLDRVIDGLWKKNASSIVHSTPLLVSGQRHHQEAAGGDPRAAGQNQSEEQRDGVAGEAAAGHLGPASAPRKGIPKRSGDAGRQRGAGRCRPRARTEAEGAPASCYSVSLITGK